MTMYIKNGTFTIRRTLSRQDNNILLISIKNLSPNQLTKNLK